MITVPPDSDFEGSDDGSSIPDLEAITDSESGEEKESLTSDTATSSCASCNFAYHIMDFKMKLAATHHWDCRSCEAEEELLAMGSRRNVHASATTERKYTDVVSPAIAGSK